MTEEPRDATAATRTIQNSRPNNFRLRPTCSDETRAPMEVLLAKI